MKIIISALLLFFATVIAMPVYADNNKINYSCWGIQPSNYDDYRWSGLIYYGRMTQKDVLPDLHFKYGGFDDGTLYTLELSRQLQPDNWLRRLLNPLVSTVELAANGTYEYDSPGDVYEFNPFILLRWSRLPWNKYLFTTFGFGEGVSWASNIPAHEQRTLEKAENSRKFLNYLVFEATFSLPSHPEWQIVYRLHHRSGVFGLYCPGVVGSTAAGVGLRYRFN